MPDTFTIPTFVRNAINLASPRLSAKVTLATDEFFAPKERMLEDTPAFYLPDQYNKNGKWMDGLESRRRRNNSHDFCVVQLGVEAVIQGVDIDTSHSTGHFPPVVFIEACLSIEVPGDDTEWTEIIPATPLGGDAHHFVKCDDTKTYNYLRPHILPDGGVARLRVFREPQASWTEGTSDAVYELSAVKNGGQIVCFNNAHYGEPWKILMEGRGINMRDGWETRRQREPGNDWIIIKLGAAGCVDMIEVDTAYFKENFPDKCSIQSAFCY